ncbi:MAG: serine O-acetyltransferase [Actinomycetota bacterium]
MLRVALEDIGRKADWYGLPRTRRSMLRMCLSDGSSAQLIYRLMRYCQTRRLKVAAMLLYRANAAIGHAVIGRDAEFGPGLVILHSYGIVINSEVRAGKNLVLEHGVTIGAEKGRSPVLGDNVFVGAGAKIIGDVRIGSDVKIGANAVVTRDLPDGATAVGVPARVVKIYGEPVESARLPREERALDFIAV